MCCRAIKTKLIGVTVIAYQCPFQNYDQIKRNLGRLGMCPWLKKHISNKIKSYTLKPLLNYLFFQNSGERFEPLQTRFYGSRTSKHTSNSQLKSLDL